MKSFEKLRGYKTHSREQLFDFWRIQKNSVLKYVNKNENTMVYPDVSFRKKCLI